MSASSRRLPHIALLLASFIAVGGLRLVRVRDGAEQWSRALSMRMVYERKERIAPRHRVEVRLDPDAQYFWSVRARFRAGEEARVIPWGFSKVPSVPGLAFCITPGNIPPANFYRFRTPSK